MQLVKQSLMRRLHGRLDSAEESVSELKYLKLF